jgi:uncharacterized flavoprotein (TIGR03862 family)
MLGCKPMPSNSVAIIGSGPAALMAADTISASGVPVTLFEKRRSSGRKLLVAGSSGLNITNDLPIDAFIAHYSGPAQHWRQTLTEFPPARWLRFIEALGLGTFLGTSGRYFIEDMKAAGFLKAWTQRLEGQGVRFRMGEEMEDFSRLPDGGFQLTLRPTSGKADAPLQPLCEEAHAVVFCLGGGSWEPTETPLRWPSIFTRKGVAFVPFTPSNVGYEVAWSEAFLREAEGKPLKNIVLKTGKGERKGEAMVTRYGLEGTPVYFVGRSGAAVLDLKPDLSETQVVERLGQARENLSPIRRVGKFLGLCPASFALLFHGIPRAQLADPDLRKLARRIKAMPIEFGSPRPLEEAISSAGGIAFSEVDEHLQLRAWPGAFVAGEMLDWEVPTGGFLIQGCVAQGYHAGRAVLEYFATGFEKQG